MLEIASGLTTWRRQGHRVAVATVAMVSGRSPRPVGTSMAVRDDGAVLGSLSGGCVEARVHEACIAVLDGADPLVLDEPTSCGVLRLVVRRLDDASDEAVAALERAAAGRDARLGLVVGGPHLGADHGDLPEDVAVPLLWMEREAAARMVVVGATDEAAALCSLATVAGYAVAVLDPRSTFATKDRFPEADEVVVAWPPRWLADAPLDSRSVVCVLAHDDRWDAEALAVSLRRGVPFVGALGSRGTHERRCADLAALGVDDVARARLHSPLGLHLRGTTPAEVAISVLAEVVASRTGGSAVPLRDLAGPVHA